MQAGQQGQAEGKEEGEEEEMVVVVVMVDGDGDVDTRQDRVEPAVLPLRLVFMHRSWALSAPRRLTSTAMP